MTFQECEYIITYPVEYPKIEGCSELQDMVRITNTEVDEEIEVPLLLLQRIIARLAV